MFIKKDLRKIEQIFSDETDSRESLKLSKRPSEFHKGGIGILCRESKLQALNNLKFLNLYENSLTSLQGIGILAQTPLEEINLGCNKLSNIPLEFGSFKNLKTLWLDDNEFSDFPVCLCQLEGLNTLRLSGNDLTYIPPSISNLQSLEVLALDNNALKEFPKGLLDLSNLKHLWLRQNKLSVLPDDLNRLSSLETLSISSNQLEILPDCMATMMSLKKIFANGNSISLVPDDICLLPHIQEVNLANNLIDIIPNSWIAIWGEFNEGTGRLQHQGDVPTKVTVTILGNPLKGAIEDSSDIVDDAMST